MILDGYAAIKSSSAMNLHPEAVGEVAAVVEG
jgi:hypothetical protein